MLNRLIANIIALLPENLVWIFSKRYIAGKNLSDAVRITKELNFHDITATIDVLGEYINQAHEAIVYKQVYLDTIGEIKNNKLDTSISVKPTMFGLLLDEEFCYSQMREVIEKADKEGISVCMDMEDSSCTNIELGLFERLYKEFPGTITLVLQAYLRRTLDDLIRLKSIMLPEYPINVRMCKGIYIEPEEKAFQKYHDINNNFITCINYMLNNEFFTAIATHDKRIVSASVEMLKEKEIALNKYEFQMLFGVRPALRNSLVKKNHPMRIYVPYGTHWFGYSTRRLKENPGMVPHIIKALIFRG